jgi:glycine reductase
VVKIVHYVNQFFAGIGGEDSAYTGFETKAGAVGPGMLLAKLLSEAGFEAEITTAYCGDTYAAEHVDEVMTRFERVVRETAPDVVVLGPAFNSGRYGLVCGELAARIPARTGVPAITGLYEENAAVGLFRSKALIARTGNSAMGMASAMEVIAGFVPRLAGGESVDSLAEDALFGAERRSNGLESKTAADRAVDVLLQVLKNVDVGTELSIPDVESVPIPEPVRDLSTATIALVTEGGLVPTGNPDRLSTGASERWGAYPLDELLASPGSFESIHGGYDTQFVNESPFRLVPIDALVELVQDDRVGALHPQYYVTSGTATKVENCRLMGSQIAKVLKNAGVEAVILTGT